MRKIAPDKDCAMCLQVTAADAPERFWSHVSRPDGDAGCWVWTGKTIRGGYGDFVRSVDGKWRHTIAHRLAWQETHGPIPEGMEVCHRCDNPPCVNPAHLFLGTRLDNERDKIAKGRRPSTKGAANPNARLRAEDVQELRRMVAAGVSKCAVARRFGLNLKTVSRIAAGLLWAELGGPIVPIGTVLARRGRPSKPKTDVTEIRCGRCREVKPLSEYAPSCAKRGAGYCHPCHREYYRRGGAR